MFPKITTLTDFNFLFWLSMEAFLTQYLIPLTVTCFLYIKIGLVVSKQGRIAGKASDERKKRQSEARRRRIIMLVLVVAAFAACWFPLNLLHLLVDFKLIKYNWNLFMVCHWIAMSSVCYNPFIYCWLNDSFRKGATKLFRIICWCCFSKTANINRNTNSEDIEIADETANNTLSVSITKASSVVKQHQVGQQQSVCIENETKSTQV